MKHDVLRPVTLALVLEPHMKFTVLVALFTVFGAAVIAETTEPTACEEVKSP